MAQIETLNLSSVCYTIGTGIFVGFISAVFISWHIGVFAERINSRFISWLLTFVTLYAVHFLIVFLVTLAMSAGQSIL